MHKLRDLHSQGFAGTGSTGELARLLLAIAHLDVNIPTCSAAWLVEGPLMLLRYHA